MMDGVWTWKKALQLIAGVTATTCLSVLLIYAMVLCGSSDGQAAAVFSMDESMNDEQVVESYAMDEVAGPNDEVDASSDDDKTFRMEVVRSTPAPAETAIKILIYHSHTWEAFQQVEDDRYTETEKWRTRDNEYNVVAVGRALAGQLKALGCTVVHDETAFEPPDFEQAYVRSLDMLEERHERGEVYDLYIDLHRDAISATSTLKRTVNIHGTETARFMMLIGKGTGAGFDVKPDWEANLAVAQRITDRMNQQVKDLCRDVKVKTGRFNQHIAPRCVLIECGNNLNTLEQVLNGIPYLADAIVHALRYQGE